MTIPDVRRGNCLVTAAKAVRATEPLTRLIACSVADHILEDLSASVEADRVDSEVAMINAFAAHDDLSMEVSSTMAAILLHAQEAARISGGLVDPVVGLVEPPQGAGDLQHRKEPYRFDADERQLYVRRGTVLDLWDIGCAWAAEEIVARVLVEDPAASLGVVVGPAIVSIGAAWEISEAFEDELRLLEAPLRCGLRSFAVLDHTSRVEGGTTDVMVAKPASRPWWNRAAVAAEDAVQALTFLLMAERLGDEAYDHIVKAGGQAEFVGPRGTTPLSRRVRTPGWRPKAS